ncbi:ATP-dependent DNA helicase PIF4-like [Chenopodium quinoa]|uniref:ATP-dependent DNA helicase PIF4-like n=1 Tax=Chenopodium quinoa TaxID=63459 RepID=UPI000B77D344|nr:ATP-dependent DNA helicase PIF4-like [Chenopodium quinoa]
MRTVNGQVCDTVQKVALKLKLLEEDDSVDICLKEGYFRLRYAFDPYKVRQLPVKSVEWFLESMGSSLAVYGLDHLVQDEDDGMRVKKDIEDALNAPMPKQCLQCKNQLNQAQREAFDVIMDHVTKKMPGAFFIDGPGGTGKTFLYNALYAEIRLMNKIVLPTAASGITAANISSGRTAHSRFKIPLDPLESRACSVPKQGSLAALLRETTLIIWGESWMAKKDNVESLDMLLRDICDPHLLF